MIYVNKDRSGLLLLSGLCLATAHLHFQDESQAICGPNIYSKSEYTCFFTSVNETENEYQAPQAVLCPNTLKLCGTMCVQREHHCDISGPAITIEDPEDHYNERGDDTQLYCPKIDEGSYGPIIMGYYSYSQDYYQCLSDGNIYFLCPQGAPLICGTACYNPTQYGCAQASGMVSLAQMTEVYSPKTTLSLLPNTFTPVTSYDPPSILGAAVTINVTVSGSVVTTTVKETETTTDTSIYTTIGITTDTTTSITTYTTTDAITVTNIETETEIDTATTTYMLTTTDRFTVTNTMTEINTASIASVLSVLSASAASAISAAAVPTCTARTQVCNYDTVYESPEEAGCCDNDYCSAVTLGSVMAFGTCLSCVEPGSLCKSNADCCGSTGCVTGSCQDGCISTSNPCVIENEVTGLIGAQCCSGLICGIGTQSVFIGAQGSCTECVNFGETCFSQEDCCGILACAGPQLLKVPFSAGTCDYQP